MMSVFLRLIGSDEATDWIPWPIGVLLGALFTHVAFRSLGDDRREVRLGGVARRVGGRLLGIPLLLGDPIFPPHRSTNVSTPANIVYGAISGFSLGDGIIAVESLAALGRKPSSVIDSLS
jgi:hypothetical protein